RRVASQIRASRTSREFRGEMKLGRYAAAADLGRALRSSLPESVCGRLWSSTNAEGTIYSGKAAATKLRSGGTELAKRSRESQRSPGESSTTKGLWRGTT